MPTNEEISLPLSKPKQVTLRAFEIKNPNLSKTSSNAKASLTSKLAQVKLAKERCMVLNPEDPNQERDVLSYFKESPISNSVSCTMLRITSDKDVQHITDTLFEKEVFSMDDIETAHIDASAICKNHYYFSMTDEYLVTNLPLNKTIARLQTYLSWFTNNDLLEFTPLISAKGQTKLSDLKAIIVRDPEPLSGQEMSVVQNSNATNVPATTEGKKSIKLTQKVLDIIRSSMSDTEQLNDIALSQMISAELLIKFKKPRKMTDDEYKKALGAYLKPVSDLDNISFKRKDNKTEVKGKDLLLTKRVSIETTQSGKLVEHQLLQEMSKFLVELRNDKTIG
ncbi:hypothetical protein CR678_23820 [Salmonella enterica]|nr:hypothetical protein [Salmonella enterica]EBG9315165.1 hypothetical protein [Salmonella enterica subsp. enterica serovar Typhi]EBY8872991.1 hypothetical protein [Salmonella enterica subsp. enterica serovar Typhimurium]EBD6093148.1 hypothetical protein [Salmonella enterica]EBK4536120.1 hypothetical protein [Salmonella enterica]